MAIKVDMPETAAQFSALVERVQSGEEILLSRDGILVARLTPVHTSQVPKFRVSGQDKGKVVIASDFDAPLPTNILKHFFDPGIP